MEKLTITRLGQEKVINFTNKKTNKPDSFKKIGFQTKEQGDRWYDFAYRTEHKLEVDKTYEFITKSREYNGKTYYDAEFPKKDDIAAVEITALKMSVDHLKFLVDELKICVKGLAYKAGIDVTKDFSALRALAAEADRGYKYPVNNLPEATFEQSFTTGDIDPENIPF